MSHEKTGGPGITVPDPHFNSKVKAGDLLCQLDPATYEAAYSLAQADENSARAALELQQRTLERKTLLLKQEFFAQADFDKAKADLSQAEAAVQVAEARVKRAKVDLMTLFRELNDAGLTIIMVTHEADVAAHARRTVVMRDGQIRSDDRREPPAAVAHPPIQPKGYSLLGFVYLALNILATSTRALLRNKLRTFLTALGIIIGVGAVIAMVAIGKGASSMIEEQIRSPSRMSAAWPPSPSSARQCATACSPRARLSAEPSGSRTSRFRSSACSTRKEPPPGARIRMTS